MDICGGGRLLADEPRLLLAAKILLFVVLTNLIATLVTGGIGDGSEVADCTTANNVTTCESEGRESFFQRLVSTTVTGFEGGWPEINLLWGVVMSTLLTVGVLLAVSAFIPFLSR